MTNSITSFFNRKGFSKKAKLLCLFGSIAVLGSACKKNSDFYLNDTPQGQPLKIEILDTSTVWLHTERQGEQRTDDLDTMLLGTINDPLFGRSTAGVYTQVLLSTYSPKFKGATLDSTVLNLKFSLNKSTATGNLADQQKWNIYQLSTTLNGSAVYRSDSTIPLGDLLGTYSGNFSTTDSVLHIKLNTTLANKLFAADSTVFNDNTSFAGFIKGLAILPDSSTASGKGALIPVDFVSPASNVVVYYNDSFQFKMIFGGSAVTFNHFSHDYTGTPIAQQLSAPGQTYGSVYMQSAAGLQVHIELPYLAEYIKSGHYALNQAQIVIPIVDSPSYPLNNKYAPALYLRARDVNGADILDQSRPTFLYQYFYRSSDRSYSFLITKDIQYLLNQVQRNTGVKDYGFNMIIPTGDPAALKQMVIPTQRRASGPKPKLVLTFTKI